MKNLPSIAGLLVALVTPVCASDIEGSIRIERRLTPRAVTAQVGAYQRGKAPELGLDPPEDPLSFERSHVVIYVEGKNLQAPPGAAAVEMEQRNRRFAPDLIVVAAGSKVSFPNHDIVFHNVFSLSKTKVFDLGNYPKDQTRMVAFPDPGIVLVYCHLHSNMAATIFVTPNGYATLAAESGKFSLSGLPAGTYTVVAWHKAAGFFKKTVTVDGSGNAAVDFFIPLPPLPGTVADLRK